MFRPEHMNNFKSHETISQHFTLLKLISFPGQFFGTDFPPFSLEPRNGLMKHKMKLGIFATFSTRSELLFCQIETHVFSSYQAGAFPPESYGHVLSNVYRLRSGTFPKFKRCTTLDVYRDRSCMQTEMYVQISMPIVKFPMHIRP